ncbi:hypothetical protein ACWGJ2_04375 [Streptomyces sp. NPDC054796]
MNRNKKHPERPTHRRKASAGDTTKNTKAYRVTGSWDTHPDRPAVKTTPDRRAARRIARDMAAQGAYVIVEEHLGFGAHRTLYEVDGPAQLAERQAAQQAAADEAARARRLDVQRAAEQRHRYRLAAEVATHARTLMAPPAIVRPENVRRARHITGAQR